MAAGMDDVITKPVTTARLAAIREGIDDRNPDVISRNAHTLKGAMSNFPGSDAQSLAAEIEQAGKDGNYVLAGALQRCFSAAAMTAGVHGHDRAVTPYGNQAYCMAAGYQCVAR